MSAFDPSPTLTTERLVLRTVSEDDADAMYNMMLHPDVRAYWSEITDTSPEDTRARLAAMEAERIAGNQIRWAFTMKETGEYIGSAGFWRWMKAHRRGEIGYELGRAHWGKGYMQEGLTVILAFGFDRMNLHSVEANLDPHNARSAHVLERIGFCREAHFRENYFVRGEFCDTWSYSLLARDFVPSRPSLTGQKSAP